MLHCYLLSVIILSHFYPKTAQRPRLPRFGLRPCPNRFLKNLNHFSSRWNNKAGVTGPSGGIWLILRYVRLTVIISKLQAIFFDSQAISFKHFFWLAESRIKQFKLFFDGDNLRTFVREREKKSINTISSCLTPAEIPISILLTVGLILTRSTNVAVMIVCYDW